MTKRTITIWWLIGTGVLIVGGLLALFSSLALASHIGISTNNFQPGATFVPDSYFWTLISFIFQHIKSATSAPIAISRP